MDNKKPKLIAFLVCDQVISEKNGKHSLIGIFSDIHAENFPVIHSRMVVFMAWLNEGIGREYGLSVVIEDSEEEPLEAKIEEHKVKFNKNKQRTYGIFTFNSVKFPQKGTYRFVAELDGQKIGELPIKVGFPPN